MIIESLIPEEQYNSLLYDPPGVMDQVLRTAAKLPRSSIIAFHGWAGSGKSCSARWLGQKLDCRPIHLDNFRKMQPDGSIKGFDENAMRRAIEDAKDLNFRIVDGICACRVCEPALLVTLGSWQPRRVTRGLQEFIGSYDPTKYRGSVKTFKAQYRGTNRYL